jgi:uncharacterized protein YjiS (DUF1127 family)
MTERIYLSDRARAGRFRAILIVALVRLVEYVSARYACGRDRRLLARHDDRTLRDMGIDRATVEDESSASFWRLR